MEFSNTNIDVTQKKNSSDDCAICLQPCLQPVQLPCNHIFCFLCFKAITLNHHKHLCPMCRSEIAPEYIDNPHLIAEDSEGACQSSSTGRTEQKNHWFYSGANGWWEYDERTAEEIEEAYNRYTAVKENPPAVKRKRTKKKTLDQQKADISSTYEIMIVGVFFVIDFEKMVQYRKGEPYRKRNIKREMRN